VHAIIRDVLYVQNGPGGLLKNFMFDNTGSITTIHGPAFARLNKEAQRLREAEVQMKQIVS